MSSTRPPAPPPGMFSLEVEGTGKLTLTLPVGAYGSWMPLTRRRKKRKVHVEVNAGTEVQMPDAPPMGARVQMPDAPPMTPMEALPPSPPPPIESLPPSPLPPMESRPPSPSPLYPSLPSPSSPTPSPLYASLPAPSPLSPSPLYAPLPSPSPPSPPPPSPSPLSPPPYPSLVPSPPSTPASGFPLPWSSLYTLSPSNDNNLATTCDAEFLRSAHRSHTYVFSPPNPSLFLPSQPVAETLLQRLRLREKLHLEDISWWTRGVIASLAGTPTCDQGLQEVLVLTGVTGSAGPANISVAWNGVDAMWWARPELPLSYTNLAREAGMFLARPAASGVKLVVAPAFIGDHWILLLVFIHGALGSGELGTVHPFVLDTIPDGAVARGTKCVDHLRRALGSIGHLMWQSPVMLQGAPQQGWWECGYIVCKRVELVLAAWTEGGEGEGRSEMFRSCSLSGEGGKVTGLGWEAWWEPTWGGDSVTVIKFAGKMMQRIEPRGALALLE